MTERVLVTGGAGFIGSTIVDLLVAEGREVAVVDDFSSGSRANLEGALASGRVTVDEADIRSDRMREIVEQRAPGAVAHLAAQIDVRASVLDPVRDADVNVLGTLNVLEASVAAGVRKVVVASSAGIYGEEAAPPLPEDAPGRPKSPYAIGKRVLGDYLDFYREEHGLASVVLVLANVYGPRQDPFGEAGVVAIFLSAMLRGEPTVIYGDGSQTRDFVYVADVASAFGRALERGEGTVNVGTGTETSVSDLWKACAAETGYAGAPGHGPPRPRELQRSALDCAKAARELGWTPQTALGDGLAATAAFIREQLDRQARRR